MTCSLPAAVHDSVHPICWRRDLNTHQRGDEIARHINVLSNLGEPHYPVLPPFLVKIADALYSSGETIIPDFEVSLVREQENQSIFGAYVMNASLLKYLSILKG